MIEWYAMANGLATAETPLDELSLARVHKAAAKRLPKCRAKLRIALIAAVLLVLTACGVAAVRYTDWFGSLVNPLAPEESEDLLASIGTVLDRSQTVDGVTVTLHSALYDGSTFLLSLSVEGLEAERRYSSVVDPGASWLYYSRADCEAHWEETCPEEADWYLAQYEQMTAYCTVNISRQFDMERCLLLAEPILMPQEGRELVLHLEQLEVQGQTVAGPFEFTFVPEKKEVSRTVTGSVWLTAPCGELFEVTEIVITPFEVQVFIGGRLQQGQPPAQTPELEELRLSGAADTWSLSSGSWIANSGDGTWEGRLTYGTLERVLDPSSVTAIRIDDTWVELSELTQAE